MHSGSIEGSPNAGPQIWSSNAILSARCRGFWAFRGYVVNARRKTSDGRYGLGMTPARESKPLPFTFIYLVQTAIQTSNTRLQKCQNMAPLRRYLRITKHSVLEVRIYLDRPADVEAWLLKRDNPALPRVIQAIRPLVLPKLREENERGRGRSGAKAKKKGVKDVVVEGRSYLPTSAVLIAPRQTIIVKYPSHIDR